MNILVIDGQGGMIGRQLITEIRRTMSDVEITAVGTNTLATASMLKAGADSGATGENAVIVCTRSADVIIGPIGKDCYIVINLTTIFIRHLQNAAKNIIIKRKL